MNYLLPTFNLLFPLYCQLQLQVTLPHLNFVITSQFYNHCTFYIYTLSLVCLTTSPGHLEHRHFDHPFQDQEYEGWKSWYSLIRLDSPPLFPRVEF